MKTITIVTELENYDQAIYINGILKYSQDSIYANEIAEFTNGEPVIIEAINVELANDEFPEVLNTIIRL